MDAALLRHAVKGAMAAPRAERVDDSGRVPVPREGRRTYYPRLPACPERKNCLLTKLCNGSQTTNCESCAGGYMATTWSPEPVCALCQSMYHRTWDCACKGSKHFHETDADGKTWCVYP